VEFLGRVDRQVKFHGFRVEPGEIEALLQRFPGVRQAVVVARDDKAGPQLLAYVVPAGETTPSADALRDYLRQRVPDYMVPVAFVALKTLPMTANGKINTDALPEPGQDGRSRKGYIAPRNDVEQKLADIWKEVLGVERVGAADDFFELGGHSLLATQIIARVRNAFQVQVPMRSIFQNSTLSGLAEAVVFHKDEEEKQAMDAVLAELEGLSEEQLQQILALEREQGS